MNTDNAPLELTTTCCIVGGGPAGMMLGYLLARAGIAVVVLEKHGDFLRDFRGDTVHPSTLDLMDELGILDELLQRPHQEVQQIGGQFGQEFVMMADFSRLKTRCKFLAFMPQWEFLDFIAGQAKHFSGFDLRMNHQVTGIIEQAGQVVGVKVRSPQGEIHVKAQLVIGADGRSSVVREAAGLEVEDVGAPMDVLWFALSRKPSDPPQTLGRVDAGIIFIMLNRDEYWQCGYVIPKGRLAKLQADDIEKFRQRLVKTVPVLADRVAELRSWEDIKLLTVKVDRLKQWYRPGLLCIGDAAHAMSPIGGVGINLAIQDAVATANILWKSLADHTCNEQKLEQVQRRRTFPTRATQRLQVLLQKNFVQPTLESDKPVSMPFIVRMLRAFPQLRSIPARTIGVGFRPEHIGSPCVESETTSR